MSTTRTMRREAAHNGIAQKTTPRMPQVTNWLIHHSITLLRVSMGIIILGYGALKFFPGVSPAENLVKTTMGLLTFGLMPSGMALTLVAALECAIGLLLIVGRGMRVTICLLSFWIIGVLSPVVLLTQRLFSGPNHAPTLEGQYVLKDIVFLTAILVIESETIWGRLRGGHCGIRCSCEAGVPSPEVVGELVVEDSGNGPGVAGGHRVVPPAAEKKRRVP